MIKKYEVKGVHADTDDKLKKYVAKSVAKLESGICRVRLAKAPMLK